jgi:cellobiose phosphorylase
LQIDPCIPSGWNGFKVIREFRNTRYEIEVQNPEHVCQGVKSIWVDGKPASGNIVPIFVDGQTHQVIVKLSKNSIPTPNY